MPPLFFFYGERYDGPGAYLMASGPLTGGLKMAVRSSNRGDRVVRSSEPDSLPPVDVHVLPVGIPELDIPHSEAVAQNVSLPPYPHIDAVQRWWHPPVARRLTQRFGYRQLLGLKFSRADLERGKICAGRKSRREVLFARRKAGFRGSAPGPYRRRFNSQYGC